MNIEQMKPIKWEDPLCVLPQVVNGQTRVYIMGSNNSVTRGMFYYNGGKPVFASYGSEIKDVAAWACVE